MTPKVRKRTSRDTKNENKRGKLIRDRMSKDRKNNDEKEKDNDLQITTQKAEDRAAPRTRKTDGAPKGLAVPVPLVTLVVLLLNDANIICYSAIRQGI
jgi:hypothetical protein